MGNLKDVIGVNETMLDSWMSLNGFQDFSCNAITRKQPAMLECASSWDHCVLHLNQTHRQSLKCNILNV